MNTEPKIIIERLLPFGIAGILFGLLYSSLFYQHTLVQFAEASTIGLILGLATGIELQQKD